MDIFRTTVWFWEILRLFINFRRLYDIQCMKCVNRNSILMEFMWIWRFSASFIKIYSRKKFVQLFQRENISNICELSFFRLSFYRVYVSICSSVFLSVYLCLWISLRVFLEYCILCKIYVLRMLLMFVCLLVCEFALFSFFFSWKCFCLNASQSLVNFLGKLSKE